MPSLGKFGKSNEPIEDLDFEWFGAKIRVHPDASDLGVGDGLIQSGTVDIDTPEGADMALGIMREAMFGQIHPDDVAEFWRLAKLHRQQLRDIVQVSRDISAGVADFRSGQRSDSSATQRPAPLRSVPGSSSVDGGRRAAVQRAALDALPDRPDMRVALYRQAQADAAADAEAAAAGQRNRSPLGVAG